MNASTVVRLSLPAPTHCGCTVRSSGNPVPQTFRYVLASDCFRQKFILNDSLSSLHVHLDNVFLLISLLLLSLPIKYFSAKYIFALYAALYYTWRALRKRLFLLCERRLDFCFSQSRSHRVSLHQELPCRPLLSTRNPALSILVHIQNHHR